MGCESCDKLLATLKAVRDFTRERAVCHLYLEILSEQIDRWLKEQGYEAADVSQGSEESCQG